MKVYIYILFDMDDITPVTAFKDEELAIARKSEYNKIAGCYCYEVKTVELI